MRRAAATSCPKYFHLRIGRNKIETTIAINTKRDREWGAIERDRVSINVT